MLRKLFHTQSPARDNHSKWCCLKDMEVSTRNRIFLDKHRSSIFRGKEYPIPLSKSMPSNHLEAIEDTEQFMDKLEKMSAPLFGIEVGGPITMASYGDAVPTAGSVYPQPEAGTKLGTTVPIHIQYHPIPKAGKPSLRMSMFVSQEELDDDEIVLLLK